MQCTSFSEISTLLSSHVLASDRSEQSITVWFFCY